MSSSRDPRAESGRGTSAGLRAGEVTTTLPATGDAALFFIGRIRTPFADLAACPHRGDPAGPECRIDLDPAWRPALRGLAPGADVQVLYWLDRARRDVVIQHPRTGDPTGSFALRSPLRPNPIGSSVCRIDRLDADAVIVRGLDCVDGTPLLDLRPARCPHA